MSDRPGGDPENTIREALDNLCQCAFLAPFDCAVHDPDTGALAALDALVSERAQLREALAALSDLPSFPVETDDGEYFMGYEAQAVINIADRARAALSDGPGADA